MIAPNLADIEIQVLEAERAKLQRIKSLRGELDRLRSEVLGDEEGRAFAIRSACATVWDVTVGDLVSPSRRQPLADCRQAAMYLIRRFTRKSLNEIGAMFGDRDHGTVIHACAVMKSRKIEWPDVKTKLDKIVAMINNEPLSAPKSNESKTE
jgi:chromosomal replication initiation ATPase DnaA